MAFASDGDELDESQIPGLKATLDLGWSENADAVCEKPCISGSAACGDSTADATGRTPLTGAAFLSRTLLSAGLKNPRGSPVQTSNAPACTGTETRTVPVRNAR